MGANFTLKDLEKIGKKNVSAAKAALEIKKQKSKSTPAQKKIKEKTKSKTPVLISKLLLAGVPMPRWADHSDGEFKFHPKRRWALDVYWEEFGVAIEIEGGVSSHMIGDRKSRHLTKTGYENDREKYFEAAMMGIFQFSVTPEMINDNRACAMALRALTLKGWTPTTNTQKQVAEGYLAALPG